MLVKQNQTLNFAQGLDTKTDPWQVPFGKFLSLVNSVFTKGDLLLKRNGQQPLASIGVDTSKYITTFNGDLTAIGTEFYAYSTSTKTWVDKGFMQPVCLSTLSLIRNNLNQTQADIAVALNGLICTVYTELNDTTPSYKYAVSDSQTGQNIVIPTVITNADVSDGNGTPRVFVLGNHFIIAYTAKISMAYHIQYIAISTFDPTIVTTAADITTSYTPSARLSFDASVLNNALYFAWDGASSSGIKMAFLTNTLALSSSVNPDPSHTATMVSVSTNADQGNILVAYGNNSTGKVYLLVIDSSMAVIDSSSISAIGTIVNVTGIGRGAEYIVFYEVANNYGYGSSIPTNFIQEIVYTPSLSSIFQAEIARSVGLASKCFLIDEEIYFLTAYQSAYQDTYFLMNESGQVVSKLAYSNGGGYLTTGLPSVTVTGSVARFPYLFKDLLEAVNKGTALVSTSTNPVQVGGIYSQRGINLGSVDFDGPIVSSEIGQNLNISGGFLWGYDGYSAVENNFFLWPDSVQAVWADSGGSIVAKPDGSTNTAAYWYQVTYEWTDNQGNAYRSAPSVPVSVDTTGSGTSGTITLDIPTLRLTYKISNPVKIVIYRWSVGQEVYYQTTSITAPILNDVTIDSVEFLDKNSDATILGGNILYTTGGVVEDINGPATSIITLFDDRLWLVDAEDQNLLWFSKQVIESTPVEMSDLLTVYVAPTISAQGSTGPITALAAMDDKLLIFKRDAIYYLNGSGPDNTGSNSQYSQPTFITSTVGCSNPSSIVFIPSGLMFQSDKGIWLLGRDLSTQYIGSPVEAFNSDLVQSSISIPGSNQVRFTLKSGIILMYDYYYGQWGTFEGTPCISSTLFQGLHTLLTASGSTSQESPGVYLDGSNPVLMSFTTSWLNLSGLQGYQRAYFFFILGRYLSPHTLLCSIAYNYNPSPTQATLISPDNFTPTFGGTETNGQNTVFGQDTHFGGVGDVERWRVFLDEQRCSAFKLTIQEVYDPSFKVPAGAGLTLSGINIVYAVKKGWRPISADHSVGGS